MATEAEQLSDADRHHEVPVKFTYLNTNEDAEFRVPETDTLQATWDIAYDKLGEAPRQGDQLQCADGTSMMGDLGLTIAELRERHVCPDRHFEIRSETGGA